MRVSASKVSASRVSAAKVSASMSAPAVAVPAVTPIREVARRMDGHGVGSVVVTEGEEVCGIVTDRDLAVRVVAAGADPAAAVGTVMSSPVVTVEAGDDIHTAYRIFRTTGVRRLPVLDGGRVVGVLTVDDLLMDVFQRVADLLGPVAWSVLAEPPGPPGPPDTA
ncbi:cyclic nucleotide-binding/CBS domain-containing protein [Streptomyces sp. NPDC127106]|uniref:CBS domain-containing protein n=1 Tax=Streptomyces sp. NPDC127106 TaxID=3345360 RepID=UPI00363D18A4